MLEKGKTSYSAETRALFQKELLVGIGGLNFLFCYMGDESDLKRRAILDYRYAPFAVDDYSGSSVADFTVNIHPHVKSWSDICPEELFESRPHAHTDIWDIYKDHQYFYVTLHFSGESRLINQVLRLSRDNHHADLFLEIPIKNGDNRYKRARSLPVMVFNPLDQFIFFWEYYLRQHFLLHSSAFKIDGKGYIALAESTGGKTTLLTTLMGNSDQVNILNDEKNIIHHSNGDFMVSASPWFGSLGYCHNRNAPLEAIFFISKSEDNRIEKIGIMEALQEILKTCIWPGYDRILLDPYMNKLQKMLEEKSDSLFRLYYKKETDVYSVIRGMH